MLLTKLAIRHLNVYNTSRRTYLVVKLRCAQDVSTSISQEPRFQLKHKRSAGVCQERQM